MACNETRGSSMQRESFVWRRAAGTGSKDLIFFQLFLHLTSGSTQVFSLRSALNFQPDALQHQFNMKKMENVENNTPVPKHLTVLQVVMFQILRGTAQHWVLPFSSPAVMLRWNVQRRSQ